jgi:hypothetical protein
MDGDLKQTAYGSIYMAIIWMKHMEDHRKHGSQVGDFQGHNRPGPDSAVTDLFSSAKFVDHKALIPDELI